MVGNVAKALPSKPVNGNVEIDTDPADSEVIHLTVGGEAFARLFHEGSTLRAQFVAGLLTLPGHRTLERG
jgi:hypothetical protein